MNYCIATMRQLFVEYKSKIQCNVINGILLCPREECEVLRSACLYVCAVCMCARSHISKTTCPNFAKFSARIRLGPPPLTTAIRHVFPVLWMTSSFHVMGQIVLYCIVYKFFNVA